MDDSNPPELDTIAHFGQVRWYEPGLNESPQPIAFGACCYPDGLCDFVEETHCSTGDWRIDVPCDPNPCPQPEACCLPDGACIFILADECLQQGYEPQGAGTDCDPNPCIPVSIEGQSWGRVKALFR